MSIEPQFPLLDFGDSYPPDKSSIETFDSLIELGVCNLGAYLEGCLGPHRRFYSRNGTRYRIANIDPEPQIGRLARILSRICYSPTLRLKVTLAEDGTWDVEPVKERIRALLANDPGDLLYQWSDRDEWERGLSSASTPEQLFEFLTTVALVDHYDYSSDDD